MFPSCISKPADSGGKRSSLAKLLLGVFVVYMLHTAWLLYGFLNTKPCDGGRGEHCIASYLAVRPRLQVSSWLFLTGLRTPNSSACVRSSCTDLIRLPLIFHRVMRLSIEPSPRKVIHSEPLNSPVIYIIDEMHQWWWYWVSHSSLKYYKGIYFNMVCNWTHFHFSVTFISAVAPDFDLSFHTIERLLWISSPLFSWVSSPAYCQTTASSTLQWK